MKGTWISALAAPTSPQLGLPSPSSLATCPQGWCPPRSWSSLFTLTTVFFLERLCVERSCQARTYEVTPRNGEPPLLARQGLLTCAPSSLKFSSISFPRGAKAMSPWSHRKRLSCGKGGRVTVHSPCHTALPTVGLLTCSVTSSTACGFLRNVKPPRKSRSWAVTPGSQGSEGRVRLEKGFVQELERAQKWGRVSQTTGGHQRGEGRPLGGRWGTEVTWGTA